MDLVLLFNCSVHYYVEIRQVLNFILPPPFASSKAMCSFWGPGQRGWAAWAISSSAEGDLQVNTPETTGCLPLLAAHIYLLALHWPRRATRPNTTIICKNMHSTSRRNHRSCRERDEELGMMMRYSTPTHCTCPKCFSKSC